MSMSSLRLVGERQHGLVTMRDLREHLTDSERRTAVRRGWLVQVRPHVYRLAGATPTWRQAVLAAVLRSGPSGHASHATAAALWGMPGFVARSTTAIEITVQRGQRPRLSGVRVHQATVLPEHHVTTVDHTRVTSAARTLCDIDGRVSRARLSRIVDELLIRRVVSLPALADVHAEIRRGRGVPRAMADVLAERREEWQRADSRREAELVRWLVEAGLPPPVQQHTIDGFRIDLAYPDHRLLIEYDGFDPHVTRTAFDGDRRRQNALLLDGGAVVLRYTSASTREEVVRDVTAALRRAS
jgi:very-short-patch-repair endonuclease